MRFGEAMTSNQFQSLGGRLMLRISGFCAKGPLLYAQPLGHVLRGFYFEDSGFDPAAFYVWTFFLPLYLPTTHISFTFGQRLAGDNGERWTIEDPKGEDKVLSAINTAGLPYLSGTENIHQLALVLERRYAGSRDPYVWEALALSFAMNDDNSAAVRTLDHLLTITDPDIAWQKAMRTRAEVLKRDLCSNPIEAKRTLSEWEQTTVKNLRLVPRATKTSR